MEQLEMEIRRLVYTVICFQCLVQLTEGSVYRKYIKVFSYLLTMYICCSVIFSFAGQLENSFNEAEELYSEWEREWRDMIKTDNITDDIDAGEAYYEKRLWEDKIIGGAREAYGKRNETESETETVIDEGGDVNGGEAGGQTAEGD